jgi:hypothetical protein
VETQPKISTTSNALCELHKCGVGLEINKKKEGKYREPLQNKSMYHLKKISFWKVRTTQKRNVLKPKNSKIGGNMTLKPRNII